MGSKLLPLVSTLSKIFGGEIPNGFELCGSPSNDAPGIAEIVLGRIEDPRARAIWAFEAGFRATAKDTEEGHQKKHEMSLVHDKAECMEAYRRINRCERYADMLNQLFWQFVYGSFPASQSASEVAMRANWTAVVGAGSRDYNGEPLFPADHPASTFVDDLAAILTGKSSITANGDDLTEVAEGEKLIGVVSSPVALGLYGLTQRNSNSELLGFPKKEEKRGAQRLLDLMSRVVCGDKELKTVAQKVAHIEPQCDLLSRIFWAEVKENLPEPEGGFGSIGLRKGFKVVQAPKSEGDSGVRIIEVTIQRI
jgi:hypothetical protein